MSTVIGVGRRRYSAEGNVTVINNINMLTFKYSARSAIEIRILSVSFPKHLAVAYAMSNSATTRQDKVVIVEKY